MLIGSSRTSPSISMGTASCEVTVPCRRDHAVEKALSMWTRVEVPVLGLIENMSGFVCPSCGHHEEIFAGGGGRKLAERAGLKFLGDIPLESAVSRAGDDGTPIVVRDPKSKVGEIFARPGLRRRLPALGPELALERDRQAQLEADADSLTAPRPGVRFAWRSRRPGADVVRGLVDGQGDAQTAP